MCGRHGAFPEVSKMSATKTTWTTEELTEEFTVLRFSAPYVVVVKKSTGEKGSLEFSGGARHGTPRVYSNFMRAE